MAKPAHVLWPPSPTASPARPRRPRRRPAPSPAALAVLATLAGVRTAGALPTEHDVPEFLCPPLRRAAAEEDRPSGSQFAQTTAEPTGPSSSKTTTTSSPPAQDQAHLERTSPYFPPAEPWPLVQPDADAARDENSISPPRYRRSARRRARRRQQQQQTIARRGPSAHHARNIPDRYEQGDDGLWHKVEFYASCSRCQSEPHDVETTSSDLGVDHDSSGGTTVSAADTAATTSTLPSLKYPDNWVRQGSESGLYKVTVIVIMSLFIAAAVCCCIAIAILWRRRRKRAIRLARERDLEKRKAVEGSGDEYDEMDEEGGSEAGCCDRRRGETKEERRRRRKAELAALARDREGECEEENREKKRWARASARWKSHVRWIRRRRTGNKRILESMMERDAAASCISILPPSSPASETGGGARDGIRESSGARRRSGTNASSETHLRASSSSTSVASGSYTSRSRTTSGPSSSIPALSTAAPPTSSQGGGNAQFAMLQGRSGLVAPSSAEASTGSTERTAALSDHAPASSSNTIASGSQALGIQHLSDDYDSLPRPPANPRSGSRRAARASVDSACTYDHPPLNSPPLDISAAHTLTAGPPEVNSQNRSLASDLNQTRNTVAENDDDLQQRPPAYRSRWRGSRSGNISEEGDGDSDDEARQRRARRNEKSASGPGYVPAMDGEGLTVLHVATDDKHVLARLTQAASAPPPPLPPALVSPPAPSFSSDTPPAFPPAGSEHARATAPAAPEWEDEVAFYANLDSPGAGPSHSPPSAFLPAPPKPVSSSLAFAALVPPPPPPRVREGPGAAGVAVSAVLPASGAAISGRAPGGSGDDARRRSFVGAHGPSSPPSSSSLPLSSPSCARPQQPFSRYTFAEEELFADAEPEAGPSAPPFTDSDVGAGAGAGAVFGEASAPPLFEDDDEYHDDGDEEMDVLPGAGTPLNQTLRDNASSPEERVIPSSAVR